MASMSMNKMSDYWNYTCETFFDACRSGKLLKVESMLERERRSYKKFKRSNSSKPFISVLKAVNPVTYMSALMVATKFSHNHVVQKLLEAGAPPNIQRYKFQDTALHLGAQYNNAVAIEMLLKHDADRLIRNAIGNLPINIAVDMKHFSCIETLTLPPQPPTKITCIDATPRSLTFEWNECISPGIEVLEYGILVEELGEDTSTRVENGKNEDSKNPTFVDEFKVTQTHRHFTIEHLKPGFVYLISVMGRNIKGWGSYSNKVPLKPKPTVPDANETLSIEKRHATAIDLKWDKPICNGYAPKEYQLQYRVILEDYENYANRPKDFIDKYKDAEFTPAERQQYNLLIQIEKKKDEIDAIKAARTTYTKVLRPLERQLDENKKKLIESAGELDEKRKRLQEMVKAYQLFKKQITSNKKSKNKHGQTVGNNDPELMKAYEQLRKKEEMIEAAKNVIYSKNGMLLGSWVSEEELRHARLEVEQMKKELRKWAKSRKDNKLKDMEAGVKSLEWDISSHEARNEAERRTLEKQVKKVAKKKKELSIKYDKKIEVASKELENIKKTSWKEISVRPMLDSLSEDSEGIKKPTPPLNVKVANLSPFTRYTFRIRARNAVGMSKWSKDLHPYVKTLNGPYEIEVTSTTIHLKWVDADTIDNYVLLFQDRVGFLERPTAWHYVGRGAMELISAANYVVRDLIPCGTYRFMAVDANDVDINDPGSCVGNGTYGISNWIVLPGDSPSPVQNLRVTSESSTTVTLAWETPKYMNSKDTALNYFTIRRLEGTPVPRRFNQGKGSLQREREKRRKKAAQDAKISAARERNKSKYSKKKKEGKNQVPPGTATSIRPLSRDGNPETEEKSEGADLDQSVRKPHGYGMTDEFIDGKKWKKCGNLYVSDEGSFETMESEERHNVEGELPIEHELSRKTFIYTVQKLNASTWYKFKVSASNSAGSSDYVETSRYVQTRPSLPYYKSKKLPWITDKSDSTLLLNWKKFESLGEPVINYQIQYKPIEENAVATGHEHDNSGANDVAWNTFPYMVERCEAKIENLLPGKKYIFRVRASNILGFGEFCNAGLPVSTVSAQPALIDKVKLMDRSHKHVTIQWDQPESNGKNIDGYDVQYQKKGVSSTGWQTSEIRPIESSGDQATIFKLEENIAPGDAVRFRIRSHNEVGWSIYGATSEWIHVPFEAINDLVERSPKCDAEEGNFTSGGEK